MDQTQYFSNRSAAQPDELRTLTFQARGLHLTMSVASQVFSGGRLDPGTQQLLVKAPSLPEEGTFLDLGCGWGPLAVTMALESPEARVWAVDVNERALDLAARNGAANGVTLITELAETALQRAQSEGTRFDVIWSNPPIRVGKKALHDLLEQWLTLLSPTGVAYLVVAKNLGADSLTAWLNQAGFDAIKIASKKGYRIIQVKPASSTQPG